MTEPTTSDDIQAAVRVAKRGGKWVKAGIAVGLSLSAVAAAAYAKVSLIDTTVEHAAEVPAVKKQVEEIQATDREQTKMLDAINGKLDKLFPLVRKINKKVDAQDRKECLRYARNEQARAECAEIGANE